MSVSPTLTRFSDDVRSAADLVQPLTAGQLAERLIRESGEVFGVAPLREPLPSSGAARPVETWLSRCEQVIAPAAVTDLIDARLVILALGRLDERVGTALRSAGVERRLLGESESILRPWAQRSPIRGFTPRARFTPVPTATAFSPDGRQLALAQPDGILLVDTSTCEPIGPVPVPDGGVLGCGFTTNGLLAALLEDGRVVRLRDGAVLGQHSDAIACSIGGTEIATFAHDGTAFVWRVTDGTLLAGPLDGDTRGIVGGALHPYGLRLAVPSETGVRLWRLGPGAGQDLFFRLRVVDCTFSPDGERLAAVFEDGFTRVLDIASGADGDEHFAPGSMSACRFTDDGRLLLAAGRDGLQAMDIIAGRLRGEPTGGDAGVGRLVTGPGGLAATTDDDGVTLWEPVTATPMLAAVSPDSIDGTDLLGVAADAAALADVIAAKSTVPPLSIGLFADWGSGKSFLIRQVQARVRELALRARAAPDQAAHCGYVRNVEFNAWHFADANLWASLATHILDQLGRAEKGSGDDPNDTAAQLQRLEEQLAAQSGLRERLDRAQKHTERTMARKKLLFWTWGLAAGGSQEQSLAAVRDAHSRLKLLLPNRRALLTLLGGAAILAALVAGVATVALGLDRLAGLGTAVVTAGATFATWLAVGAKQLGALLKRAGPATALGEVRDANVAADAKAAKAREDELRKELADLSTGRRLARFAAERGASDDYRSQLGIVSRIHDDFSRMSDILAAQGAAAAGKDDLPRIDRVVLYIDDLDRCPPKRVVEVLEAVHLILALPLFVVVLAVDPRWLLQSLQLHYSELLEGEGELEEAWRSTPLNYLEKIIQIPFTLRPMGPGGTAALVASLLPVFEPAPPAEDDVAAPGPAAATTTTTPPGTGAWTPDTRAPAPRSAPAAPVPRPLPRLSPRTLVLTEEERDFATFVARELRTPRAVKKLTNVYRLVRARLDDESDALDTFLAADGGDIPDYQAVLILLTVLIAFPGQAAELLLAFGDLDPAAEPARVEWSARRVTGPLGAFLDRATAEATHGAKSTTEPFRRWALELSRYSFETGQEVYSKAR